MSIVHISSHLVKLIFDKSVHPPAPKDHLNQNYCQWQFAASLDNVHNFSHKAEKCASLDGCEPK